MCYESLCNTTLWNSPLPCQGGPSPRGDLAQAAPQGAAASPTVLGWAGEMVQYLFLSPHTHSPLPSDELHGS